jgi:hypothetical protein
MGGGRRGAAPRQRLLGLRPSVARRVLLALVLLAVVFFPVSGLVASGQQQQAACRGCSAAEPAITQSWTAPLPGTWLAGGSNGSGGTGTVPAGGQAYVAVGGGMAVVGDGLTLTAFSLDHGRRLWQATLPEPAGASIMSVRAWPGAVTVGILAAGGRTRTEAVVAAARRLSRPRPGRNWRSTRRRCSAAPSGRPWPPPWWSALTA